MKTGILMMNMGGPRNSEEVNGFLNNLFADRDIIRLPWQVTTFLLIFIRLKNSGQGQLTVKGSSNRMLPRYQEPILG